MTEELNKSIRQLLGLYKLVNADVIEQKKEQELGLTIRKDVYESCDTPRTAREVGDSLKMTPRAVRHHLNHLVQRGLLETWAENGVALFARTI